MENVLMQLLEAILHMENKWNTVHYIKSCFGQAFSLKLVMLIVAVAFCICLDTWNQIPYLWSGQASIDVYYYLFNSITYGGTYMPYLMPVLAATVYAVSYSKESSCGIRDYVIGRLGYGRYAFSKAFVSIVCGGITAALGVLFFCVYANYFQPIYIYEEGVNVLYYTQPSTENGIWYIVILIYLTMLSGMLWSMVALLVSAYFENIYVTIASPLLISYMLARVYVLLGIDGKYRLDYWLSGRAGIGTDEESLCVITIFTIGLIVFLAILFYRKMKMQMAGGKYE